MSVATLITSGVSTVPVRVVFGADAARLAACTGIARVVADAERLAVGAVVEDGLAVTPATDLAVTAVAVRPVCPLVAAAIVMAGAEPPSSATVHAASVPRLATVASPWMRRSERTASGR